MYPATYYFQNFVPSIGNALLHPFLTCSVPPLLKNETPVPTAVLVLPCGLIWVTVMWALMAVHAASHGGAHVSVHSLSTHLSPHLNGSSWRAGPGPVVLWGTDPGLALVQSLQGAC